MSRRLCDRLVIILGSVLSLMFFSEGIPEWTVVSCVLFIFIISILTELRSGGKIVFPVVAGFSLASFFFPEMLFLIPASVYALLSVKEGPRKQAVFLAKGALLFLMAGSVIVNGNGAAEISAVLFLMVLSGYLSIHTGYSLGREEQIREKYDTARLESMNAKRLGEEIMKNTDNEVYMARLRERNRIAREMHDNVGHMITRVIVQLQAIKIINRDQKVGAQLESMGQTLDLAMTGMRKSVHELHDESIDLSIGINEISSVLKDRFDVTVRTMIDSPAGNAFKNAVLGIVKEAVTNISKYSSGDRVLIEIVENISFWRIKINDNGKNPVREYDLTATVTGDDPSRGGIGLQNIGSRAKALGGRATVISGEDGFTVLVTVPKKGDGKDDKSNDS